MSATVQVYDTSRHREYVNPQAIPRIIEVGDTAGGDSVAPRVNQFAGAGFFALTSGSLNTQMAAGGAEQRDLGSYRMRASASYVTGTHNARLGYEGAIYTQTTLNQVNDVRMTYNYVWPNATCAATLSCGNTSLQFPEDPNNLGRRPIPNNVQFNTGAGSLSERVMYGALYAQDQWTIRRLTLNGALRYDHATSRYNETCVGPDLYVPVQANGDNFYCVPPADGVSFNDITPRMGVAWDLFGTGRTSVKWNMGRYNQAAGINGVYANANAARRTVNLLQRNWNDADGDRVVDCNLMNFAPNGECAGFSGGSQDTLRYGRNPIGLDEAGIPIGLAQTQCGRPEKGIPQAVQDYCAAYGESMLEGRGRRQGEWQFGIGIQHEVLPRLSAEVTFNRRSYLNLTATDTIGIGCDRFLSAQSLADCQAGYENYVSPTYDFFTYTAPVDPRLPGGGGYRILGLNSQKLGTPGSNPQAQTLFDALEYTWNGIDTNFVWRGPGGLRINGGTSTGRARRDTCDAMLDSPNVKGREGNALRGGCLGNQPFQTRVNGTAAYVIPWVDVLVSTVFQSFPGVERTASLSVSKESVVWAPTSTSRATAPCQFAFQGVGCFGSTGNTTTTTVNLLDNNELYGERVTLFDLKLAKNIRFGSKRVTVGVDIYNVFNSDAIQDYNDTWTLDNPATPENENLWGDPAGLVSPRFVRASVQFYF